MGGGTRHHRHGPSEIQHLNRQATGCRTGNLLIVTTDRRTYHLKLRSTAGIHARVSFTYPETAMAMWEKTKNVKTTKDWKKPFRKPVNTWAIWILPTPSKGIPHGNRYGFTTMA